MPRPLGMPDQLELPAAWYGADLQSEEGRWVRHLSAGEVAEIEQAAAAFIAADHPIDAVAPGTFVLPSLKAELSDLRETLQHGRGFGLIRGLPVARYDMLTAATIFCGIGAHLGSARSQNAKGHILGHVKDVGADVNDPTVRIYQTAERQSFHTDSSDVVGLLCLKEAMEGGDSLLVSTLTLYNEMMKRDPALAGVLFDPIATDRRGEVPAGEKPYFEIPVLNWHGGKLTGLYQRTYIESAARFDDAPALTAQQLAALDLFDDLANDPAIHLKMRLKPGDMQFVYNHTMLHDRTGFRDWPKLEERRHLLRLWLALPGDRPLPEIFKQRYGSIEVGDRGGIITSETRLHVALEP
ncbi:MAG: TauD/TfdA family dioxygenase [Pseudomonadota bacterium]